MFNFASESSIHDISFIFGENRSKFVRVLWIFILFASFCGFSYYFKLVYIKWSVAPDITIKISSRDSQEFPLPAITICPMIFSRNDRVNLNEILSLAIEGKIFNATQAECEQLFANLIWCGDTYTLSLINGICQKYFTQLEEINILDVVNTSAYLKEELLSSKISDKFTRIYTHNGICFTYNMQDFSAIFSENIHDDFQCYKNQKHPEIEWNVERGYFKENATYPENAFRKSLLLATMMNHSDANNPCITKSIFVYLHQPNEIPTEHHESIVLTYGSQTHIQIGAKSHRTNENLRSYSSDIRKCYFDDERKLEFFKTYTKTHCLVECKRNVMMKACGCVIFYMPRNKTTKICRLSDMKCVYKKESNMQEEDRQACSCLPSCNYISYAYVTNNFITNPIMYGLDRNDSLATLWMVASYVDTVEEIENFLTYTLANFVSDVGGLLGLFVGCSLLSIVEIFYFMFACLGKAFKKQTSDVSTTEDLKNLLLKFDKNVKGNFARSDENFKDIFTRIEKLEKNSLRVEDI